MACKRSAVRFRLAPPIAQPIHNRNIPQMLNIPLPRPLCPGGLLLSALFIAFLPVHAAQATDALPDAHAPIGVMADHMHKKGEYMISLRRMSMRMKGNYADNDKLSDAAILMTPNTHGTPPMLRVVPQNMDMTMTMIGAMYAPSDKVTLLAMVNLLDNDMRLTTYNMNAEKLGDFDTSTSGLGDSVIGALFDLPGKWHSGLAFGLPTGATDKTGRLLTPMNMRVTARLPYAIQLGGGTFSLKPSLTRASLGVNGGWGVQLAASLPLGRNKEGWRHGASAHGDIWASRRLNASYSLSLRGRFTHNEAISGADALIDKPVQSANPDYYGGQQAELALGVNFIGGGGALHGHRLALEYTRPVWRNLNGPQMGDEATLTLGYQKSF